MKRHYKPREPTTAQLLAEADEAARVRAERVRDRETPVPLSSVHPGAVFQFAGEAVNVGEDAARRALARSGEGDGAAVYVRGECGSGEAVPAVNLWTWGCTALPGDTLVVVGNLRLSLENIRLPGVIGFGCPVPLGPEPENFGAKI